MMKHILLRPLLLLAILLPPVAAPAQTTPVPPTATPRPAPIVSPEVQADGRVTFRFKAPDADGVKVSGEWDSQEHAMAKDEAGVWSVTLGPLAPGIYGYSFNVDGVALLDPSNTWVKPSRSSTTSSLEVLGAPGAPRALTERQPGVARGTVHLIEYNSRALGRERRLRVYTPAEYEARPRARFPVLYLLHGSGDNEAVWTEFGRAHVILDNLIAAKRAVPMIVVMPDGHAAVGAARAQNAADFSRDLLQDVMPLAESRFRIRADRQHRAIAGLSMGGNQALLAGLNHRDRFAWVGGMSSSIREPQAPLAAFWADPVSTRTPLRLLWLAIGRDDFLLKENRAFDALLREKKVPHEYAETEGSHQWPVWRRYLAALAPRLFQPQK